MRNLLTDLRHIIDRLDVSCIEPVYYSMGNYVLLNNKHLRKANHSSLLDAHSRVRKLSLRERVRREESDLQTLCSIPTGHTKKELL